MARYRCIAIIALLFLSSAGSSMNPVSIAAEPETGKDKEKKEDKEKKCPLRH